MVVAVIVEEGCLGYWHQFWDICSSGSQYFDIYDPDRYSGSGLVVSTAAYCSPHRRRGMCSRRVIEVTSTLMGRKLALELSVRPIVTVLIASVPWVRGRFRAILQQYNVLSIGAMASAQTVTWMQISLLYSHLAPLVGVLGWLAIGVNFLVGSMLVGGGGLVEQAHGAIPLWCLPLTLAIQWTMTFLFMVDIQMDGLFLVVFGYVAVFIGMFVVWFWLERRPGAGMSSKTDNEESALQGRAVHD